MQLRNGICSLVALPGGSLVQIRSGICLSPLPDRMDACATPHWYLQAGCSAEWLIGSDPQWYMIVSVACSDERVCNSALVSARWLLCRVAPWLIAAMVYACIRCLIGGTLVQLRTGICSLVALPDGSLAQICNGICLSPLPARMDACATPHWYVIAGCSAGRLLGSYPQW